MTPAPRPDPTASSPSSAAGCGDGLLLSGGALTLTAPHPIIARRTFLWRADTGAVIEALGFAGAAPIEAGSSWLAGLGPVQEQAVGADSMLGWAGIRPFNSAETHRLREVARFAAAPRGERNFWMQRREAKIGLRDRKVSPETERAERYQRKSPQIRPIQRRRWDLRFG